MTTIHIPRIDPQSAMDRNRPVNALLKSQILHLHEAERRLPVRHHTDIYINAIKTEGKRGIYSRRDGGDPRRACRGGGEAGQARGQEAGGH